LEKRKPADHFNSIPESPFAIYLFCLARPQVEPELTGGGLDDGSPLLSWQFRDVVAIVSKVGMEEFCGPEAASRMQDLAWVGPRACRHEAVVEMAMRYSPVLPARFATLFSSLESLEKFLKNHYASVCRFLDRVVDKDEWAVKAMLERKRAKEAIFSARLASQEQALSCLSPGMRYLREQRMSAGLEKELNRWLQETCHEVLEDLRRVEATFERRPVLSLSAKEEDKEMVLNCAFLVPRSVVENFRGRIQGVNACHAEEGLLFELSGPWPPYSFSSSLWRKPGG